MPTERKLIVAALLRWKNSLCQLDSSRLSSIGIDDTGDLQDEVDSIRDHNDAFFKLVFDIEDGKYATSD